MVSETTPLDRFRTVLAGTARAIDLRLYQARHSVMTVEAAARWQKRYQIGAKIQAAAIGIWCATTLLATDDAVAHMIALSVTTGIAAGGAGRAYGRPAIFHLQAVLIFGPAVLALALRGTPYYIAMALVSPTSIHRPSGVVALRSPRDIPMFCV